MCCRLWMERLCDCCDRRSASCPHAPPQAACSQSKLEFRTGPPFEHHFHRFVRCVQSRAFWRPSITAPGRAPSTLDMHDGEHDAAYRAASLLAACMAGGNSVDLTKSLHALLPAARYFAVAVKVGSEAHLSFQLHLGSTASGGGNGAPVFGPDGATTLPESTASSTGKWHRMSLSACAGTLSGWVASSERAVAVLADRWAVLLSCWGGSTSLLLLQSNLLATGV
jgi:hypothetical protein